MKNLKTYKDKNKLTPDELSKEIINCIRYDQIVYNIDDLISAGANLNYVDNIGDSLLIIAVKDGDIFACESLIKAGIDIDKMNAAGNNSLMWASTKYLDIFKLLIESGADLTLLSNHGHNFLFYPREHNVKDWLNTYEAQKIILSREPSVYKYFKEYGYKIHPKIKKEYGFANVGTDLDLL